MQLSPHLHFPGTCEEAFRAYARLLGGRITAMQTYGASPGAERWTPEWRTKIVHAAMNLGERELLGADVRSDEYEKPAGWNLLLAVAGLESANRVFNSLAEGGAVKMPLQQTFWSPAFGVVVDRFGVPWEITVEGTSGE
jgi:PhnB protein